MSELAPANTAAHRLHDRGAAGQSGADVVGDLRSRLVRIVVLSGGAVAAVAAAAGYLLASAHSSALTVPTLTGAVVGCAAVLIAATNRATSAASAVNEQFHDAEQSLGVLRSWTAYFREEITAFVARVGDGEHPAPHDPTVDPAADGGAVATLIGDLRQALRVAEIAVAQSAEIASVRATDLTLSGDPVQQLQVFANLGRRQQSLIHRALRMMDELERLVEDPDLLEGIFGVDHLVTGMRRQAENLVILGGAKAPRQWSSPSGMVAVLRSATAEVEQYNRVKMVLPVEGTLRGHAVTEVIHLLAELIENATVFSHPDTKVMLRARNVRAGLAIEVEDRGLGMRPEDLDRINGLLATPDSVDIRELLNDGLIGLWVVAQLARRNDISVRLQTNIFGGVTADVVLPHALLGDESDNVPAQPPVRRESTSVGTPAPMGRSLPKRPERSATRPPVTAPSSGARHSDARADVRAEEATTATAVMADTVMTDFVAPESAPRHATGIVAPEPVEEPLESQYEYRWPGPAGDLELPDHAEADAHTEAAHTEAASFEAASFEAKHLHAAYTDAGHTGPAPGETGYAEPGHAATGATGASERPPLPRRAPGMTHLAPQLLEPPADTASAEQPAVAHSPTLVATFQRGMRAGIGEEHADSAEPTDHPR